MTVDEKNKWLWKKYGLSERGEAYIVNNKYAKAIDMKPQGAKWCPELGWHFDSPHDNTFFMNVMALGRFDNDGLWSFKPDIENIIDKKREDLIPVTDSEYIGKIGEKISVKAVFEKYSTFERAYGYLGGRPNYVTIFVFTFKANGKDTIVWMTSTDQDLEEGETYVIQGTVKDLKEFRKDKQTILTRCKISKV